MATTPLGPYTPVKRAGDWLITSGQLGISDGKLVPGGVAGEVHQALANVRDLLEGAGGRMDQIVKTTVFLHHMSDYAAMNEAYMESLGDHRPTRSAVAVAELPMGALVEIEAWAWLGG